MGNESEQLVYDYLSRVGDLAQRAMTPAERVELVARVRDDIDARLRDTGSESAVRRTLSRMGTPQEVVDAAREDPSGAPTARTARTPRLPRPARPVRAPKERRPRPRPEKKAPRGGTERQAPGPQVPADAAAPADPSPPTGAASDAGLLVVDPVGGGRELGDEHLNRSGDGPAGGGDGVEWWRVPRARRSTYPVADEGETGDDGDEREDRTTDGGGTGADESSGRARPVVRMAKRGTADRTGPPAAEEPDEHPDTVADAERDGAPSAVRALGGALLTLLRRPRELLGIVLLIAGPVSGFWPLLLAAWALLYFAPKLRPAERMTASVVIPVAVVAGGGLWLWARRTGHAGAPLPEHDLTAAAGALLPTLAWTASLATVAFLAWRILAGRGADR